MLIDLKLVQLIYVFKVINLYIYNIYTFYICNFR